MAAKIGSATSAVEDIDINTDVKMRSLILVFIAPAKCSTAWRCATNSVGKKRHPWLLKITACIEII
jgi:hypothetical protein